MQRATALVRPQATPDRGAASVYAADSGGGGVRWRRTRV